MIEALKQKLGEEVERGCGRDGPERREPEHGHRPPCTRDLAGQAVERRVGEPHHLGGEVAPGSHREYGPALISVADPERLFQGLPEEQPVWMSHGDRVVRLPPGFKPLASSANSPCAAFSDGDRILGIQFHPEVVHTPHGKEILGNFLTRVCGCTGTWTAGSQSVTPLT